MKNQLNWVTTRGGQGLKTQIFLLILFEHLSCITLSISEKLSQFAGSTTPKERKNMETNAQKM